MKRYWFADSRVKTHAFNAMHLMLVYGERYMTRTVAACAERTTSTELRNVAKAFVQQEMQHARAHRDLWPEIDRHYHTSGLHRLYAWVEHRLLPRLPLSVRLATTLAIEHNTATFATVALTHQVLATAETESRQVYEWHCAEELEHKHAVYAILNDAIVGHVRRYFLRQLGMGLAVGLLSLLHAVGVFWFWSQDVARDGFRESLRRCATDAGDFVQLFVTREALLVRGVTTGIGYVSPYYAPRLSEHERHLAESTLGRPLNFPGNDVGMLASEP